jgi:hypothetical protein
MYGVMRSVTGSFGRITGIVGKGSSPSYSLDLFTLRYLAALYSYLPRLLQAWHIAGKS